MKNDKIKTMVYLAMYVAMYVVLKWCGNLIPFSGGFNDYEHSTVSV